jgi:lipopolysaccharide/colanic/teichoic acid biosynthesis glycosyltransferase
MAKRVFDILASLAAMIVLSPVFLAAAIGILLSSPGPVLYRAKRAGRGGTPFVMHKFRTMSVAQGPRASAITASQDARVFAFGKLLRRLKIDELPQLFDVLRGEMSVVGPRPEDIRIVQERFAPEHWETLSVRPGLASPGSIFNYTHGESLVGAEDPERDYLEKLLPVKLALEIVYVRRVCLWYDVQIIGRSIAAIVLIALGKKHFPNPPEMAEVERFVPAKAGEPPAVAEAGGERA